MQLPSLRSGRVGSCGKKGMSFLRDPLEQIVKGLGLPRRTVRKRDQGSGVNFQHGCEIFDFPDRRRFQTALKGADVRPPTHRIELLLTELPQFA
jgi:hypothetical protein